MCLCHQAVKFGTGQRAVMLCGREGNRRSGVALAMRHRLQWFIHLRAQRLWEGDEHPTYAPQGHGRLYLFLFADRGLVCCCGWQCLYAMYAFTLELVISYCITTTNNTIVHASCHDVALNIHRSAVTLREMSVNFTVCWQWSPWREPNLKAKGLNIYILPTLEIDVYVWHYTLIVVYARNEWMNDLQGNPNSSSLQYEVAYWPALAVGGVPQLAAAHCPNELIWTSRLQLKRPTYAPASGTMTSTPQCSPATTHYFSSEYYQILIAISLCLTAGLV